MSEERRAYITVTQGMRGWFAVHVWWNAEDGGFWEPWQSGIGSYATKEEAIPEARSWAEAEGLELRVGGVLIMQTRTEDEQLRAERDRLQARLKEMDETLEGCDWCCGGGDQEQNRIHLRIEQIDDLLSPEVG